MAGLMQSYESMSDWRLKPRLLLDLISMYLPDENQPSPTPSQLSSALSLIRTHKLLSESVTDDSWKAAFNAWNERILSYSSTKMPDRCWAGVCMVGVTSQECSRKRFLETYSIWFQKLLIHLKPPTDSPFIKVAACASLFDLLLRLSTFSSTKKDGVSICGKLIHPLLQLLGEDDTDAVSNVADLFSAILRYFPSSVLQHFDNVEVALVSKLLSGKCSSDIAQKLAQCLALLPRVRGDGDSWNLLVQRVLLAINVHLNDAFQGFEDVNRVNEAVAPLLPPGKEPPAPLGVSDVAAKAAEEGSKNFWRLLLPRVSSLLNCCCFMLTNSYPMQVVVPLGPLLALVSRILNVNGSPCQQSAIIAISSHQTLLCTELPALHSAALDLLSAIVKGVRSHLLPRAANIGRLLTEYFRHCSLPSLRIKLYAIAKSLLLSMGVGMASCIAPDIIHNAKAELKDFTERAGIPNMAGQANASTHGGIMQTGNSRKRKHLNSMPSELNHSVLEKESDGGDGAVSIPIPLQISALEAIEALLTVGGALRSNRWRPEMDSLLITVAMNISTSSSSTNYCLEDTCYFFEDLCTYSVSDLQIASYKALLASLLVPWCHRPPYLSKALSLFRKGKQESGTRLAEFCAHALLALEPLLHPRNLPYANLSAATSYASSSFRANHGNTPAHLQESSLYFLNSDCGSIPGTSGSLSFGNAMKLDQHGLQLGEDELPQDDDIYLRWLGNGDDPNTDNLYNNPEMSIDSISLTENGGLHCSGLEELGNISTIHSSINDATCIPTEALNASSLNPSGVGNPAVDPLETNRQDVLGVSKTEESKSDLCMKDETEQITDKRSDDNCRTAYLETEDHDKLIANPVVSEQTDTYDNGNMDSTTGMLEETSAYGGENPPLNTVPSNIDTDSDAIPEIVVCGTDSDPDTE